MEYQYQNPIKVIKGFQTENDYQTNPDPYIISFCGQYYCYSTGENGVNVLRSKDLTTFEHLGTAYSSENEYSFWAPAVFYDNGMFYLYYSSLLKGETDDHKHYLRLAKSTSPIGPFEFEKTLIHDFAIDPHVFRVNNEIFLLYSRNVTKLAERIGTVICMDQMTSLSTLLNEPHEVVVPSIDEEIFARNRFGDGKDWHTIEGGFYLARDRQYIFYSGNAYTSPDYFVGYATAELSERVSTARFTKQPDPNKFHPLIAANRNLSGTGHNSIIRGPDNYTDFIVYHGRESTLQMQQHDGRKICVDPIRFSEGTAITPAPTCDIQRIKLKDTYSLLKDEDLHGEKKHFNIKESIKGFVLDVWFEMCSGTLVFQLGNNVRIQLDPNEKTLYTVSEKIVKKTFALCENCDFHKAHHVWICAEDDHAQIEFDDSNLGYFPINGGISFIEIRSEEKIKIWTAMLTILNSAND